MSLINKRRKSKESFLDILVNNAWIKLEIIMSKNSFLVDDLIVKTTEIWKNTVVSKVVGYIEDHLILMLLLSGSYYRCYFYE